MAGLKDISSVWNNIKEIDLKPIRDAATGQVKITIAGAVGAGKHTLAGQMRSDPVRVDIHTQSPVTLITIQDNPPVPVGDLIILMVEASKGEYSAEQTLVRQWSEAGKNVLVFVNKSDLLEGAIPVDSGQGWMASQVISGSAKDTRFLQKEFVPAVLEMLPQKHLALGRQFPLFRLSIANQLINETCFSNAAYSFSTGLAEIVPVLDLPLNLTDLIVLTKSQAFLAYKLGLLVGFSTRWQDYVTEFGGVIGGGFVWRQAARSLVGLVPGWGIIPKVAIAYSGTYVVGHAILGWYLSGRHLNSKQMRELSVQAFTRGKEYARKLLEKMPKRRSVMGRREAAVIPALESGLIEVQPGSEPDEIVITKHRPVDTQPVQPTDVDNLDQGLSVHPSKVELIDKKNPAHKLRNLHIPRLSRKKKDSMPEVKVGQVCSNCGKTSSTDAVFCQYCGVPFEVKQHDQAT